MAEGFTSDLVGIYVGTTVVCAWLAMRRLPWPIAVSVSLVRTTIVLLFFALWNDGRWLMLDDVAYFNHAAELLQSGYNPLTVICTQDGFDHIRSLSGGNHILYTWFNLTCEYFLGVHYYSSVFANIALSFVAAHMFAGMLRKLDFEPAYCLFGELFFLLHWDVVAWTSFVNLKDILVLTLTLAAFYSCVCFIRSRSMRHLSYLGGVCFLFYWIRFYIPVLILCAIALWLLTQWDDRTKYLLAPIVAVGFFFGLQTLSYNADFMHPEDVMYGSLRFMFTPIPWNVEPGHSFLILPAILHWLMGVPSAIGAWALWNRSVAARLQLLYLLTVLVFYGITEELQGPRHRFQITFILAWLQIQFLWDMRPARRIAQHAEPVTTRRPRLAA